VPLVAAVWRAGELVAGAVPPPWTRRRSDDV